MTGRRDHRGTLLARMPAGAVCAEIGVWKGDFSQRILERTAPRELHLIDPWAFQPEFPERMYGGSVAKGQADMDEIHRGVEGRFAGIDAVRIHRATSADALATFPDGTFDWVYVDGNHYYEYVLEDLRTSWRKVRPGGMIAGDDYTWGEALGFPVRRAVLAFAQEAGLAGTLEVFGAQFVLRS